MIDDIPEQPASLCFDPEVRRLVADEQPDRGTRKPMHRRRRIHYRYWAARERLGDWIAGRECEE